MKREDQDVDVPYGYNEALDKVVANDCKLIIRPRESSLYILPLLSRWVIINPCGADANYPMTAIHSVNSL